MCNILFHDIFSTRLCLADGRAFNSSLLDAWKEEEEGEGGMERREEGRLGEGGRRERECTCSGTSLWLL